MSHLKLNCNNLIWVQLETEAVEILNTHRSKNPETSRLISTARISEEDWYEFQMYEFISIFGNYIEKAKRNDVNKQIIKGYKFLIRESDAEPVS